MDVKGEDYGMERVFKEMETFLETGHTTCLQVEEFAAKIRAKLLCNTCLQPIAPEDPQFHFHASHFTPVFRGEVDTKELKNDVMALPVERVHKNLPDGGHTDKPYVELNKVMDLLTQKELRPDWKQAVLGLSWIPLNHRHDVIRNIERVSATSEGAHIGTPEYLLELVRWYQQHDDAESANIVMKAVKELELLKTPFVDENDKQQFLFHAEGRAGAGVQNEGYVQFGNLVVAECQMAVADGQWQTHADRVMYGFDKLREQLIAKWRRASNVPQQLVELAYTTCANDLECAFAPSPARGERARRLGDEAICPNCSKPLREHGFACIDGDSERTAPAAEGRGEVGQDARNFTPGALIYCEQCKTNHRISDFGKMFHTRPAPREGEK